MPDSSYVSLAELLRDSYTPALMQDNGLRRKIFTQYVITQYPFWGLLAGYVILTGQRVFVTTKQVKPLRR